MILQVGMRTDIPAFYSEWFMNRVREKYVLVRNPYNPQAVTRYEITPDVVDLLVFCTKNPKPLLSSVNKELAEFRQYWFVTITPYDTDLEPRVPSVSQVIESVRTLAEQVGAERVTWRYDPILITEKYTVEYHLEMFRKMAEKLSGSVGACVISFVDLYPKVQKNFPELRSVSEKDRIVLAKEIVQIGKKYAMEIRGCGEGRALQKYGVNCEGCMSLAVYEKAIGHTLRLPKKVPIRRECACFMSNDIGQYNTCPHGCRYCYANTEPMTGLAEGHDKNSPMLIGHLQPGDKVHVAEQKSFIDRQMRLEM